MAIDDELEAGLMKDLAESEEKQRASAEARGASRAPTTRFQAKGLRIKGKVQGQRELANVDRGVRDAIEELVNQSGISEEAERRKADIMMTDRFNRFKLFSIQKASELEKRLAKRKASQAERQALGGVLGGVLGSLAEGAIGGLGGLEENLGGAVGTETLGSGAGDFLTDESPISVIGEAIEDPFGRT